MDESPHRQIESFLSAYVHCIDDDRLEEWPDFFTDDAVYKIISRSNYQRKLPIGTMHCAGRAMLTDRVLALRRANLFERHHYRHLLSAIELRRVGQEYTARSNYVVMRVMHDSTTTIFSSGNYLDRIVMINGEPLLRERLVVCDQVGVETLLAIPL